MVYIRKKSKRLASYQKEQRSLREKRERLAEIAEKYVIFNYQLVPLNDPDNLKEKMFRKDNDGNFIYCRYCDEAKLTTFENRHKLYVVMVMGLKCLACSKCQTLQCYTCFALIRVQKEKYISQICLTCYNRYKQESKPTKRCECSPDCKYEIPITNNKGEPQKYAHGHNLKTVGYNLPENIKARRIDSIQ